MNLMNHPSNHMPPPMDDDDSDDEALRATFTRNHEQGPETDTPGDVRLMRQFLAYLHENRNDEDVYKDLIEDIEHTVLPIEEEWYVTEGNGSRPEVLKRILVQQGILGPMGTIEDSPILTLDQEQYSRKLIEIKDKVLSIVKVINRVNEVDQAWDGQVDNISMYGRVRGRLQEMIQVMEHAIIGMQSMISVLGLHANGGGFTCTTDSTLNKYYSAYSGIGAFYLQSENKEPFAALAFRLLRMFQVHGYRKKKTSDKLFERHFLVMEDGSLLYTYCYRPLRQNLQELIYEIIRKETDNGWPMILRQKNISDLIAYLKSCVDNELPSLDENTHMYSTRDGVYDVERDLFARYDEVRDVFPELAKGEVTTYMCLDITFSENYFSEITPPTSPRDMDIDEDDLTPYYQRSPGRDSEDGTLLDIDLQGRRKKTYEQVLKMMPTFLQILRDQEFSDATIELFLAMLGRTLWKLGEKDDWQVWPLFLGASGVGKSTIIKLWGMLFHPEDVGVISPDAEQSGFGKERWLDARILVAPETRGDKFGLSGEMALTMMSGDSVQIPVKYGKFVRMFVDGNPL